MHFNSNIFVIRLHFYVLYSFSSHCAFDFEFDEILQQKNTDIMNNYYAYFVILSNMFRSEEKLLL